MYRAPARGPAMGPAPARTGHTAVPGRHRARAPPRAPGPARAPNRRATGTNSYCTCCRRSLRPKRHVSSLLFLHIHILDSCVGSLNFLLKYLDQPIPEASLAGGSCLDKPGHKQYKPYIKIFSRGRGIPGGGTSLHGHLSRKLQHNTHATRKHGVNHPLFR